MKSCFMTIFLYVTQVSFIRSKYESKIHFYTCMKKIIEPEKKTIFYSLKSKKRKIFSLSKNLKIISK